jgi:hypothetical protein
VTARKIKRRFKRFSLRFLWPLLPAAFLIGLAVLLSRSQVFNLRKITCRLDNHLCPLEFEPILVNLHGQNIFKLNQPTIISQLQDFDPTLADIDINKRLPDGLTISMKRRLPVAQIVSVIDLQFQGLTGTQSATLSGQFKDQFFQLDKSGEIFSVSNQKNPRLSTILVPDSLNLNLGQNDLSQTLASLVNALKAYYVSFDSLAWLKETVAVIKTSAGIYAVLDLSKSINSQVASLQYILSNIKIEEELPTKIDLRFDKPVLTY